MSPVYLMPKGGRFQVILEGDLAERLDAWRAEQRIVPSRPKVVRLAVEEFLDREQAATEDREAEVADVLALTRRSTR